MAFTVPTQIVIGLAIAVLLDAHMPARTFFRTLFYLPVVTSWVVVSLLFRYLFLTDGGLFNWFLHDATHLTNHNIDWLGQRWTAMTAVGILGIWKGVGWSMIIFLAALQGVPERAEGGCGRRRREGLGPVPRSRRCPRSGPWSRS